jgi:hypothetical protein
MTTQTKIINDIRKIVDKAPIVDVSIVDKAPIPSSRGIGEFAQDAINRKDIESTYTLKQIIDNIKGPILHDDSNTQDVYDHVAKITGMVDNDDSTLNVVLKPNGVFD